MKAYCLLTTFVFTLRWLLQTNYKLTDDQTKEAAKHKVSQLILYSKITHFVVEKTASKFHNESEFVFFDNIFEKIV